jgi:outer membrane protein assembly factor BamE (lipoprotein component of BamABCDE complex)
MKKVLISLMLIALSLAIVACSNKEGVVTEDKFNALEEGMTKDEIIELFGEPLEENGNKWTYDLLKDDSTSALNIFFNGDELAGYTTGAK